MQFSSNSMNLVAPPWVGALMPLNVRLLDEAAGRLLPDGLLPMSFQICIVEALLWYCRAALIFQVVVTSFASGHSFCDHFFCEVFVNQCPYLEVPIGLAEEHALGPPPGERRIAYSLTRI